MLERLLHMGAGVYALWGIGLLGLLLKMIANAHLKKLLRESENMATTRKKGLRRMRQTYENGRTLGIRNGSGAAFAEKQVRKMRLLGKPFDFWRRIGETLVCLLVAVCAGAFLYYDVSWRGSPDMVMFLANGVLVGACLLALENIFLTNNKIERLKANIRDYLENLTPMRQFDAGRKKEPVEMPPKVRDEGGEKVPKDPQTERTAQGERTAQAGDEVACTSGGGDAVHTVSSVYNARDENPEDSGEELNRFLREFFS